MRRSLWVTVLSVSALLASGLWAQTETASLSVLVTDPSPAPVQNAKATLVSKATAARREALTGADGRCVFPLLAPGLYELTVEAPGFKQFRDGAVRVQVAQAAVEQVWMVLS